jgi:hypothetical protein
MDCKCQQETRITLIEREVERMKHDVLGNGKPGALDKIDKRLSHIEDRLVTLRLTFALLIGASGAGLGAAGTAIVKILMGA